MVGDEIEEIHAGRAGVLARCDAWNIGRAAFVLGAGRLRAEDPVHPGVGVCVYKKVGDSVVAGEPLARVFHVGRNLERARAELAEAFVIAESGAGVHRPPLVIETVEAST